MSEEQQLTADEQKAITTAPESVDAATYADMIAAVDAAKAGDAPAPEAKAEAKPPAAAPAAKGEPAKAEPAQDPELPAITAAIRAREAQQKEREASQKSTQTEAQRQADEILSRARSDAQKAADEIIARAKSEADRMYSTLRERPLDFVKQAGWDPDRLVNEVVQAGDPAYQRAKALEAENQKLRDEISGVKQWQDKETERQKQFVEYQKAQNRENTLREFTSIASTENAPSLRAMAEQAAKTYGPMLPHMQRPEDWIILWGDHAHAQAVQATGQGVANLRDLVQHLEYQAKQQMAGSEAAQPAAQSQQKAGKSGATQQRAQGQRTLSASTAGEKRASPKPPSQMTEAEIRAAMEAAFSEASRQ